MDSIQDRLKAHLEKNSMTIYQLWKTLSERSPTKLHPSVVYGWVKGRRPHGYHKLMIEEYLRGRE